MAQTQLSRLKNVTLTILEEVGVHVPSAKARDIFHGHGATVEDSGVVRLPSELVERAMASAPRSFVLAGREPRLDLLLDGVRSYVCTEGVGVHVVDPVTGNLRPSKADDVARLARVCDGLPLVAFFWPLVSAQDHGLAAPVAECHSGLTSTLKHVRGGTTVRPALARFIVEMAQTVAGGEESCRHRPPVCANICTISPLAHDEHGLECALTYAAAGIPVSFMAMGTMGSVAPATVVGALVQGDAEVISGMVLLQLAFPGTPVFHSVLISGMNPTTAGFVSEVAPPIDWLATQVAHNWGVPCIGGGTVSSDDAGVGWLAGRRAGEGALLAHLSGSEICGHIGMAGGTMVQYPELLVLDCDALEVAQETMQTTTLEDIETDLEIIRSVGPRGHYLKQRHTREKMRVPRRPVWARAQGVTPEGSALDESATHASRGMHPHLARVAALEAYQRLEREHRPMRLSTAVRHELDMLLAAADRAALKLV